jgi:hypothetical protein
MSYSHGQLGLMVLPPGFLGGFSPGTVGNSTFKKSYALPNTPSP